MIYFKRLFPFQYDLYRKHLLELNSEDRLLRFCGITNDTHIESHINHLNDAPHDIIGVFDKERIIGCCFIGWYSSTVTELALSVLPQYRNRGIGMRTLKRAMHFVSSKGAKTIYLVFMYNNTSIHRLAKKLGMTVMRNGQDVEAHRETPVYTNVNAMLELVEQNVSAWHYNHFNWLKYFNTLFKQSEPVR